MSESQKQIARQALASLAQKGAEQLAPTPATVASPAPVAQPATVAQPAVVAPAAQPATVAQEAIVQPEIVDAPVGIAAPTTAPAGIAALPAVAQPTPIEQIVPQAPQQQLTSMGYPAPELSPGPVKPVVQLTPEQQQKVAGYVQPGAPPPLLTQQDLERISQPTEQQVQQQVEQLTEPIRQMRAQGLALEKVDAERKQLEQRMQERETELKQKFAEIDSRVRQKSLGEVFQTGSTGQKIGMSLAVLVGGIAQGLLGQKTNPVVDFLNQAVEQQAAKDKLNNEEKEVLRRQVFEQGQLELQKLENATQNAFRKDSIRLQQRELQLKEQEITQKLMADLIAKQQNTGKWSGRALTEEQLARLTDEQRGALIFLKNGKVVLTPAGKTDADKFKEIYSAVGDALISAEQLQPYFQKWQTLVPYTKEFGEAQSLMTKLVGALRLPYTGPGVLTDTERQELKGVIGDPTKFFRWVGAESGRLGRLQKDLKLRLQHEAATRGIKEPVIDTTFYNVNGQNVDEEDLVSEFKKRLPNLSEDKIREKIRTNTMPSVR